MLEYRRVRAGQEIRQDRRALPGRHPAPAALEQNCRNLLKEDYASLFRAAPDGSHETSTGPKHASNLTGRGGAINHLHQAEGGQCNVKLAGGCGYLLGTSLQKGDIAQAQPGRPLPRKPSISGLMSTAVTFPPGVTKEAALTAIEPVPVPRSSTR